jgi:ABC-2 type transport system permease protein
MILRIARKELLDLSRDGRFRVLSALVLVVSLVSLAAGWKTYTDLSAQHRTAQQATRAQWLNQPKKNPHSAAHYGVYAFKPASQLGMVDTGIDPYVGVAVWLEAHKQNEMKFRPAQDRTAVQRFGEMNGAEVLQVLVPLFIVLMAFAAFAGEREQGTLRQLLSVGARPRDLALGKALGIAAALGLALLPATVFSVLALTLSTSQGLLADDPLRVVALVAVYLAYFALLTGLSLWVSAWAKTSRLALVVLLTFWFGNSVVAPRVASDLASWLHPTPSAVEFQKALEADLNNFEEMEHRLDRKREALLEQYHVASVDALPIAFSGVSLQEGEEHGNEVFDTHFGSLFDLFERQNDVFRLGGVVAPMLATRTLSMGLSGTDFTQHRHFTTAAETYRRNIQRTLNGDIAKNQKPGVTYLAGRELWDQVEAFDYTPPNASWVLGHYASSLLVLGGWLAAVVALMLRAASTALVD